MLTPTTSRPIVSPMPDFDPLSELPSASDVDRLTGAEDRWTPGPIDIRRGEDGLPEFTSSARPPRPLPAASVENLICLAGPCVHYSELIAIEDPEAETGGMKFHRICRRFSVSLTDESIAACTDHRAPRSWFGRTKSVREAHERSDTLLDKARSIISARK